MRGKAAATRVLWVAIGASISAGVGFVWLQRTGSWGDSTPASVRAPVAAAAARGRRRVAVEVQLDTAEAVLQPEEGPAGEGTNHGTAPPWQVESSSPLVLAYGVQGRIALPPSNKGDGGLLENARAVYGEMSTEILARWGKEYANTSIFSGGMNFSDGGKVVEDKMLNAVVGQGSFVAAFTGYSNTAGHDCLYEESYPVLLNETMGRLMAAAGTRFQGMNVAMGNTPPSPYSYCVDAHAGLDADIVSWDMSMAVSSRKCGSAASLIELFIRSASVLPKRPAVLIMDSSPDAEKCGTPAYVASVYNRNYRLFTGACDPKRPLMKLYRDFGLHQLASGSLVSTVACGDERFSRSSLYNATEKTYPNTMKWHPGPAGHLLLADMLFMHYAAVFLSALDRLEVVAPGITATQLRKTPRLSHPWQRL